MAGSIVLRRKFDPVETLQLIQDEKIEQAYFVPTHFVRFLKLDEDGQAAFDLSLAQERVAHGRAVSAGREAPDHRVVGAGAVEYYGASEGLGSGTFVDVPGVAEEARHASASRSRRVEVMILDEEGNELPVRARSDRSTSRA